MQPDAAHSPRPSQARQLVKEQAPEEAASWAAPRSVRHAPETGPTLQPSTPRHSWGEHSPHAAAEQGAGEPPSSSEAEGEGEEVSKPEPPGFLMSDCSWVWQRLTVEAVISDWVLLMREILGREKAGGLRAWCFGAVWEHRVAWWCAWWGGEKKSPAPGSRREVFGAPVDRQSCGTMVRACVYVCVKGRRYVKVRTISLMTCPGTSAISALYDPNLFVAAMPGMWHSPTIALTWCGSRVRSVIASWHGVNPGRAAR